MKRIPTFAAALAAAFTVCAAPPAGYYDSLEGKSGAELRKAVKSLVRKHTNIGYGDRTWEAFAKTDTRTVDGTLCWWDMYSSNNVPVSSGHPGMNIEHSVANSCWGGTKNAAYNDLFHLNPSDATANNRKSNYPLGIVSGTPHWTNGVTIVGRPGEGTGGGASRVYEPHDMYKGDFARVYFYIFTVYDDISWGSYSDGRDAMYDCSGATADFRPWAVEMLLRWNAADPVREKEVDRNSGIYEIQHNRNPYIDIPDLAEYVWGSKSSTPFHYDPANYPDLPDVPDNPDIPDTPDNPGTPGTWQLVRSTSALSEADTYIIVSDQTYTGLTATLTKSYLEPTSVNLAPQGDVIASVPSDIATVTLSPQGSGYAIGVASGEKATPLYISSTSAKNVKLTASPADEGTTAFITIDGEGVATVSYGSAGNLCYNPSAPRFTTYTSTGQKLLRFYRKVKTDGVDTTPADMRLHVWSEGGMLHVPASATVYDLAGRVVACPSAAEADGSRTMQLSQGTYIITCPGFRPMKAVVRE